MSWYTPFSGRPRPKHNTPGCLMLPLCASQLQVCSDAWHGPHGPVTGLGDFEERSLADHFSRTRSRADPQLKEFLKPSFFLMFLNDL